MLRRHQYYKPKQRHRVLRAPDRKSGHVREDGRARAAGIARAIVGFIFFGAVLLWFAYFFLFSGSFEIKDIRIIGNKNIPTAELLGIIRSELSRKRWGVVPSRSSLLVPTDAVADAIRSRYIVDDISVRRRLPFAISVALEEKLSRVVLRVKTPVEIINAETALLPEEGTEGDAASSTESQEVSHNNVTGAPKPAGAGEVSFAESLYYLDVNGIVVAALAPSTDLSGMPVIETIRDGKSEINPGASILNREIVELIFSLYERMLASGEKIVIAYVSYDPNVPQELIVATQEGWQAFLSTQIPLETQLQKLVLALREKIKEGRSSLQYVDLRVKDRVYFK